MDKPCRAGCPAQETVSSTVAGRPGALPQVSVTTKPVSRSPSAYTNTYAGRPCTGCARRPAACPVRPGCWWRRPPAGSGSPPGRLRCGALGGDCRQRGAQARPVVLGHRRPRAVVGQRTALGGPRPRHRRLRLAGGAGRLAAGAGRGPGSCRRHGRPTRWRRRPRSRPPPRRPPPIARDSRRRGAGGPAPARPPELGGRRPGRAGRSVRRSVSAAVRRAATASGIPGAGRERS